MNKMSLEQYNLYWSITASRRKKMTYTWWLNLASTIIINYKKKQLSYTLRFF